MSEVVSDGARVLIFRLCSAFFASALMFLACLSAKILKDYSLVTYFIYSGLCLGIILAESVGSAWSFRYPSSASERNFDSAAFVVAFLSLIVFHSNTAVPQGSQAYDKLPSRLTVEQEFDDDIELEDVNEQQNRVATNFSTTTHPELYQHWRSFALAAFFLRLFSGGWNSGMAQHESYRFLFQALFDGIFSAMSFGVICEESITSPASFLIHLAVLALAIPLGVFGGSVFGGSQDNAGVLLSFCTSVSTGLLCAIVICFAFHLDRGIIDQVWSEIKSQERRWRVMRGLSIGLGYLLVKFLTK